MPNGNDSSRPLTWMSTQQVIAGSLIAGVAIFALVVTVIRSGQGPLFNSKVGLDSPLVLVGLVVAVSAVMTNVLLPNLMFRTPPEQLKAARTREERVEALRGMSQIKLIVRYAILEGAAFLNLILFMLEGSALNLGLAIVLLLLMMAHFPTTGRIEAYLETRLGELNSES